MRNLYHDRLDQLSTELADLCALVGDSVRRANDALRDNDVVLAERVIGEDGRIDRARVSCEEHAYALLALQAPVATDLRALLATLHTADSLERMGDLAVHVTEAVRRRHPRPVVPHVLLPRFTEMGRIAVDVAKATEALIRTRDLDLVPVIGALDEEMDDLHRTLFTVVGYEDWAYGVATAIDLSLLSRCYERFADHAVSSALRTRFVVTGELREQPGRVMPRPRVLS
jgi:phosphate transport system protein